ncbi:ABC transporter ATP-binding protein [Microlunatus lacustris]
MTARGPALWSGLRAAGRPVLALLLVLQALRAALVPVSAWGTGLVVAQVGAAPGTSTAFALAVFVVALWLGESVGHALWLVRLQVARAVDGSVRSEIRLLLGSAASADLLEDPGFRDDVAQVMATGGARGYEQSIGTAAWAGLGRWFDVIGIVAAAAVLVPLSPLFAAAAVAAMLATRMVLQRTWQQEAGTESDGARGQRRTAYWTGLGTGDAVAKEVRVFGMGRWIAERRRAEAEAYLVPRWRAHRTLLRSQLLPAAMALLGGCLVLGVPAWSASTGAITSADLARYVVAGLGLLGMAGDGQLGWHVALGGALNASLDRVRTRLQEQPLPSTPALTSDQIVLEEVGFRYGDGPPVLTDLRLAISPGEVVAVVGPNGAGKTTLMKLLAGLDLPTAGRACIPARSDVAVLFQDFVRYPLPLADNVTLSAPGTDDPAGITEALALAGAGDLAATLPAGLGTPLSALFDGGVDLSGGQWQKVALARAIYGVRHGRRLLIMDEPTAHLDAGQEADFYDRVVRTLSGTTIVLVSHRLSTVRAADRIVLLDGGRITEEGSHAALLELGGAYARMFALQASRFAQTETR